MLTLKDVQPGWLDQYQDKPYVALTALDMHFDWANHMQRAVIFNLLRERKVPKEMFSDLAWNRSFGLRLDFGRRNGHSTLARILLHGFTNAILVVATSEPPMSQKQQHLRGFKDMGIEIDPERIFVSKPLDLVPTTERDGLVKSDIIEKKKAPFAGADTCIIDGAQFLSDDELQVFRAAPWLRYLELA